MGIALAAITAQQGIAQQAVSLSLIKQQSQEGQAIANILEQSAQTLTALSGRGGTVNILA